MMTNEKTESVNKRGQKRKGNQPTKISKNGNPKTARDVNHRGRNVAIERTHSLNSESKSINHNATKLSSEKQKVKKNENGSQKKEVSETKNSKVVENGYIKPSDLHEPLNRKGKKGTLGLKSNLKEKKGKRKKSSRQIDEQKTKGKIEVSSQNIDNSDDLMCRNLPGSKPISSTLSTKPEVIKQESKDDLLGNDENGMEMEKGSHATVSAQIKSDNASKDINENESICFPGSSWMESKMMESSTSNNNEIERSFETDSNEDSSKYYSEVLYDDNNISDVLHTRKRKFKDISKGQYKRRLIANARERNRVHTLGRAFEDLRSAIPSFSEDQKLSKLTILKLAISYISALDNLLRYNESSQARLLFAENVEECTTALQTEYGRAKRKYKGESNCGQY